MTSAHFDLSDLAKEVEKLIASRRGGDMYRLRDRAYSLWMKLETIRDSPETSDLDKIEIEFLIPKVEEEYNYHKRRVDEDPNGPMGNEDCGWYDD